MILMAKVTDLEKVKNRKEYDITAWPYQIIFYDEKGRRIFTDYVAHLPMATALVKDYPRLARKRGKKVPKIALIVERKVIESQILEE